MAKIILIFCLTVLVVNSNSFSQNNNDQSDLAYSQTGLSSNYVSIISNPTSQIFDDFNLNSAWLIDEVVVVGTDVSTSNNSFDVYFYNNNNGIPGTLIYSALNQSFTLSMLTWDIYQVTIALEIPAELSSGNYFISVRSFWWNQIEGSYGGAALYYIGTSWIPIGPQTGYTDMYFELYGSQVVPVDLTSFSATVNDDHVELSWITSTETNNQGFEILRSAQNDNNQWERIGFVEGHGTTTESQAYSYIDREVVTGKYQYRIKQIDFDGTFKYSNVVEVEVTSPSTFSLEQNYPNPFNPSTKIRYTIPNVIASETKQSQFVNLKIYDVLGNELATLVNERRPSGSYEVEFDASNLPSGTYFYQLRAGSFVETKKMIFIK